MAVSYLSKVYEANPYVLPVDLNLLAKVNSYKQQQFYENADKLGSMLDGLQNSDIANDAQHSRLMDKYNNLTQQLNQAGGIDFSDKGVVNQISGYGSEIYNDKYILQGIKSTKKIRTFQSNVEKMQTDPKLSKYYNVSNITRIMEKQIKPYVTGDINQTYDGPTAPRPYEGNPFEKVLKNMKNLPPNIEVRMGPSGTPSMYNIETNKFLSPGDISAAFDGLIDANTKAQLADDAWYNFDYSTGYKFDENMGADIYNGENLNKVRNYTNAIEANKIRLKTELDPEKKKAIEQQNIDAKNELDATQLEIQTDGKTFRDMYKKDRDGAIYGLYVGKFRSDLIKAAGFNEQKVDFKLNQEWNANRKMEIEAFKHGYTLDSNGNWSKTLPWGDGDGSSSKKGKGSGEGEPISDVSYLDNSTRDDKQTKELAVSEQKLNAQISNYQATNNTIFSNFMRDLAQQKGAEGLMGYTLNINTTQGGTAQTFTTDLISNIAGRDGVVDKGDIDRVVNLIGTSNNGVTLTSDGKKYGISHAQVNALRDLKTAWDAVAKGEVDKLPGSFDGMKKEFIEFNEKYQFNQMNIDNRRNYLEKVTTTALKEAGVNLSPEDQKLLIEFETGKRSKTEGAGGPNFKEHNIASMNALGRGKIYNSEYARLNQLVNTQKIQEYKDKAYLTASQTYNYYGNILNTGDKNLMGNVTGLIQAKGEAGTLTNIQPYAIRRDDDGKDWIISYTNGKDGKETRNHITVDSQTAQQLGVKLLKRPELQESFRFDNNETKEISTYTKIIKQPATSTSPAVLDVQPVVYKIIKQSEGDYLPVIVYGGKNYPIKPERSLKNTDEAYELIQTITQNVYSDFPALLKAIETNNNQF